MCIRWENRAYPDSGPTAFFWKLQILARSRSRGGPYSFSRFVVYPDLHVHSTTQHTPTTIFIPDCCQVHCTQFSLWQAKPLNFLPRSIFLSPTASPMSNMPCSPSVISIPDNCQVHHTRFSYLHPKMRPLPACLNPAHNLVANRIPTPHPPVCLAHRFQVKSQPGLGICRPKLPPSLFSCSRPQVISTLVKYQARMLRIGSGGQNRLPPPVAAPSPLTAIPPSRNMFPLHPQTFVSAPEQYQPARSGSGMGPQNRLRPLILSSLSQ